MSKIYSKRSLEKKISLIKRKRKKIVLCHGVFDLVHFGHIKHFQAAKKLGDFLVVSLTKDKFINKSLNGPAFNENYRIEYLSNLQIIDAVVFSDEKSAVDIIQIVKPNFYVKGFDYKNNRLDDTRQISLEKKYVEKYGGIVHYTNEITFSSSNIINKENLLYSDEQKNFINIIKKKYSYDDIEKKLNLKKDITVTVIGELIFDEYKFGNVVGKSGKEPYLVLNNINKEIILGGSAAIARNISSFVKKVNLISFFGFEKIYKKILSENLPKNIKNFFFKPSINFNSIVKTRYVDTVSDYKVFGSYNVPELKNFYFKKNIINKLSKLITDSNLIIISDYGHGLLNDQLIKILNSSKSFKSVNFQVNSSTKGFSNISKYKKINSLIINENELRQELKDQSSDVILLSRKLIKLISCDNLIVTSGKEGARFFSRKQKKSYVHCPAFSNYSIDKTGAGDSILALSSFSIFSKFDNYFSLLVGSLAASITIRSIGNKSDINKNIILRLVKYLLK
jgi:rfaE bifunctional protein kinase chain/domain/rfaE bifunctional protein nucleotidyltransferase chain/domain